MKDRIIIIGASGAVGSAIVKHLDAAGQYQLTLAGRRLAPLARLKETLNIDTQIIQVDVARIRDTDFLKGAALLIMCVDIPDSSIPEACAAHGVHYMDISASQQVLGYLEASDAAARAQGIAMLFSVGLAPGLTNLLAANVLHQLHNASALEIYILLGLGEAHGDQAFQWTFDHLHQKYRIKSGGVDKWVKSFTDPKATALAGSRKFYLFDFADQHILKNIKGLSSVSTRLAFDNRFFTALVAVLRTLGITRIYRNKRVQRTMMGLLKKVKPGSDVYGVKVIARNDAGKTAEAFLQGYGEGAITARVAASMVPHLLSTKASGLMHSHELIQDLPAFFEQLQQGGEPFSFQL